MHEPGEVAVDIPERPRNALGRDLERAQDRRAGALDPVERRRADGDRNEIVIRMSESSTRPTTTSRRRRVERLREENGWGLGLGTDEPRTALTLRLRATRVV